MSLKSKRQKYFHINIKACKKNHPLDIHHISLLKIALRPSVNVRRNKHTDTHTFLRACIFPI